MDVFATVTPVPKQIDSCSQKRVELNIIQLWEVSRAKPQLPLLVEDAARPLAEEVLQYILFFSGFTVFQCVCVSLFNFSGQRFYLF